MALLSLDDPLISGLNLPADEMKRAIAMAQAIAEGPAGANRKLEKRRHNRVLMLKNGVCYLPDRPVDESQDIEVAIAPLSSMHSQTYQRPLGTHDGSFGRSPTSAFAGRYMTWTNTFQTLPVEQYELDLTLNRLEVPFFPGRHTPLSTFGAAQVRVGYTAGYDFSAASTDPDALAMKAALLGMITSNAAQEEGISDFTATDFYRVKIDRGNAGDTYERSLSVFANYR